MLYDDNDHCEDDAEKIDVLNVVGKEPGEDLVVSSWASGQS